MLTSSTIKSFLRRHRCLRFSSLTWCMLSCTRLLKIRPKIFTCIVTWAAGCCRASLYLLESYHFISRSSTSLVHPSPRSLRHQYMTPLKQTAIARRATPMATRRQGVREALQIIRGRQIYFIKECRWETIAANPGRRRREKRCNNYLYVLPAHHWALWSPMICLYILEVLPRLLGNIVSLDPVRTSSSSFPLLTNWSMASHKKEPYNLQGVGVGEEVLFKPKI